MICMGFGVHPMRMVRVYEPFCYSVYLYFSVRVPSFVVTECSIVTSVVLAIFTNRLLQWFVSHYVVRILIFVEVFCTHLL